MSSSIALSHLDAYKNLKTYEKFTSLEKNLVWGFGVQGKKFVLVQQSDNLLQRIWFSFLKLIRVIKVDEANVKKLYDANVVHYNLQDYQDWSKQNNRLLPSEITLHLANHNALAAKHKELKATSKDLKNKYETSHAHSKKKSDKNNALKSRVQELEGQNVLIGLRSDQLRAVISHLKPKFNFDGVSDWLKEKRITVTHNVEEVVSTVKDVVMEGAAAGVAAAERHAEAAHS